MAWFYVKKERYGIPPWRVIQESVENGARKYKTIPRLSYEALGINPIWAIEEVRERIKALNKESRAKRLEQNSITGAANKVLQLIAIDSLYLPANLVETFITKLINNKFGSKNHNKRILSHWKTVCNMIQHLKLDALDIGRRQNELYTYCIENTYSSDYVLKLIRILNMWGAHVTGYRGSPYTPAKSPKGHIKNKINDAYFESLGFQGESDPLTPEMLTRVNLKPEILNWLEVSVWFGLRPIEIDQLKLPGMSKLTQQGGTTILWVYQSKLTSLDREKRWKGIPCILKQQQELILLLKYTKTQRPYAKLIHKVFGPDVTLYGGRKGFVDLMLNNGQSLEDISMWLGHQSIEITWRRYRNKKRVSWK